jgi:tripeptide aminopeptidase
MKAYERLLKYVVIHTTSDEESDATPSTSRQFDLAHILVDELKALGIKDARVDEKCCVYASIPATPGYEKAAKIGLIAHMDTAPDFCGENVQPRVIENYDGEDVILGDSGRILSKDRFPHLPSLKGRTLIVTDGKTLLGADDKAGVAEIMTVVEYLQNNDMPHGKVCIAFTPDEEIGRGAEAVDVETLGADFAYTIDGGEEGEITYENFNAGSAEIVIHGFNVHPGSAKNTMVNALLVGFELNRMLPEGDVPSQTEDYEGFYHLTDMKGNVEKAEMSYIIRDHHLPSFEARKELLRHIVKLLNEKYGEGTVELKLEEQYRNMSEMIMPHFHLIENAKAAAEEIGVTPLVVPIRGGTDGARLSFRGLPCPDIGTGGYAYHGPYEHITVEGMDLSVELILGILKRYAKVDGAV